MNKKGKKAGQIWSRLKVFILPYKWGLLGAVLMILISNICMSIAPAVEGMITSQLVSDVQEMNQGVLETVNFERILRIIIMLAVIYLIKTGTQVAAVFLLTNSIQSAMRDLRDAVQNKIRRLPVRYFDTNTFGDVLSKITNDVDTVSNALQQTFSEVIRGVLTLCLAIIMMFSINVVMACVALLIIPLCTIITRVIVKRSQKCFRSQQEAIGKLNGTITEMYSGYNEILLYGKQKDSIEKFRQINGNLQKESFRANFMSSIISPCVSLVTYLTIGLLAVVGSIFVIDGRILVGDLQAFIRYIWQVNDPLSQVSNLSNQIQSAVAAMSRIVEMLGEEEEVKEADPGVKIAQLKEGVTFENVSFGYHETPVLRNLNAEVKRGQMVAIVGPTGAGKTTIINLLLRFYDVLDGAIKIDGTDIREMKREDLRSLFGMVLQDKIGRAHV